MIFLKEEGRVFTETIFFVIKEWISTGKLQNIFPSLTVYIVKKPCKSLKSSGLQSFFLCYQMCVQIFIF